MLTLKSHIEVANADRAFQFLSDSKAKGFAIAREMVLYENNGCIRVLKDEKPGIYTVRTKLCKVNENKLEIATRIPKMGTVMYLILFGSLVALGGSAERTIFALVISALLCLVAPVAILYYDHSKRRKLVCQILRVFEAG